ncbi:DUF3025 domain-containing protein [Corallincola platygyrae]|uniref:DUF3025 domain-containing protein n=1 Tax=Corallincola platygyrae TaxID=1193278 RepID=A0ABW4XVV3_9GAMM
MPITRWAQWPTTDELDLLLDDTAVTASGKRVHFVCQKQLDAQPDDIYYEQRIYQTGGVPTRPQHWHDLFNALIWTLFPQTKRVINALHEKDIITHGLKARTQSRNALTLFDECGVVLAINEERLADLIQQHRWQEAFVTRKSSWSSGISAFTFGHAVYESALKPFVGWCGKALCVLVDDAFGQLSLQKQYQTLDVWLSGGLQIGLLDNNSSLTPLPILGVPGWWDENCESDFYQNLDYFRPLPQRKASNFSALVLDARTDEVVLNTRSLLVDCAV